MKIAVLLDGSEHAQKAFDKALSLRGDQDELVLLHVCQYSLPPPILSAGVAATAADPVVFERVNKGLLDMSERMAKEYKEKCDKIISSDKSSTVVLTTMGSPKQVACEYINNSEHSVQLVVCGTRGMGAVKKFFLGSFSATPQDASMYDDQHVYTHTPGSLKNTPVKGALIQSTDKISVDAELDAVAKKWIASKNSANTTSTANTTSNATVNATTKANATQASQVNKTTVTAVKAEDLKKTKVNATDMPSDPVGQGAKTVANMTANATIAKKKSAADMPSDPVGQGAKTVANVTANATIATQKK